MFIIRPERPRAKLLWERLGLPALRAETPWHGDSLADWTEQWDVNAKQATQAQWRQRRQSHRQRRRGNVEPNTPARSVKEETG